MGTTIQVASSNNWSYVLLGAPQPQLLAGRRFAVYGKNGLATDSGTFTLRGTMFQKTDVTAINTLLNQSIPLGDDLTALDSSLGLLLHKVPGVANQALPQKVFTAFQIAASDSGIASALLMLEGLHPGLARCAGQAFAETITTATTYEVRETNPNTGAAGDVLGRVTITPGTPIVLPAPGFPFQVVTNAPSDHLRIRLRWGTSDTLRRLSLLQFGFNVWRLPFAAAVAAGFNVTPPTPAQLHSGNYSFTQVNLLPVMATKDYGPLAGLGGPDDPTDRTTYFFVDSNGRSPGSAQFPPGQTPPGYLAPPFNDGDQFYYFIATRDVLGRDGLVSPGGLATACRKNLPSAPTQLSVLNSVQVVPLGGGFTNQPGLLVRWRQNTNVSDVVTQYWVYRWPNPTMALTNDATPSNNVVGIVPQIAGTNSNSLLDTSPAAPATPGPSNFWYTVRAVSQSACGQLLFSPNSAPVSGVLRQRAAPPGTSGELVGSCGTPVVMFQQFNSLANPSGPDPNNWNYRLTVTRRDAGIAWATILVGNPYSTSAQLFGPLYFPPDGNSISVDVSLAVPAPGATTNFQARCQVGTYYGVISQAASCQTTNTPSPSQITEAVFSSGELLFTALSSSDPFLQAVNFNQSSCLPAINPTRDASGTVHMSFDVGAGAPMLIQYNTNSQYWTDLGIATPDTNGVYSIYLCPCVISPLPPLRGCTVNLPGDGNCNQHVARAGSSGPIAPIHVRFRLTPRTREYRLYRSVNGGRPTLVAQSAAMFDPNNPSFEIVRTDDAMPPSAARLCYFVQVLDENGNGSPLALMGCKDVVPCKPPTPVLSQPTPAGDTSNPQVALNWFCPTSGVYRFEIRIRADQSGSGKPTGFINSQLSKLTAFKPLQSVRVQFTPRFYGLTRDRSYVSVYDEWQLTPPIGPSFGAGPQFATPARVLPNVTYHISVAAEDIQGDWGDASTEWTFVWQPPPTNLTVAWPARPLPPVKSFDEDYNPAFAPFGPRVSAVLMYDTTGTGAFDSRYPVGIRIGDLSSIYYSSQQQTIGLNVNTTNFAGYTLPFSSTPATPGADPQTLLFKRFSGDPTRQGESLLPIIVYRQQVTNAAFPRVSGNVTQVTPLIEGLPWTFIPPIFGTHNSGAAVAIDDLLIAFGAEFYALDSDIFGYFMYVRDQQPVILGASYQYFVVRFNTQHETSETIPAGIVTIPTNP